MKNYKEVEMLAKNAPTGSYAAGCPVQDSQQTYNYGCQRCELGR